MGANQWDFSQAPLFGQSVANPDETQMLKKLHGANDILGAYRPEMNDARMQAMQQTASLFNPVNNALNQMYGPGSTFDLGNATRNPMSEYGQNLGKLQPWLEPGAGKREKAGTILGGILGGPFGGIGGAMLGKRKDMRNAEVGKGGAGGKPPKG